MPKIHFSKDFDFSPPAKKGDVTIVYKAGSTYSVTTACSKAAIAAGKGALVSQMKTNASSLKKKSDAVKK